MPRNAQNCTKKARAAILLAEDELTDEQIAAALERARRQVCLPHDPGCFALLNTPERAEQTMTADGWIEIGWITAARSDPNRKRNTRWPSATTSLRSSARSGCNA